MSNEYSDRTVETLVGWGMEYDWTANDWSESLTLEEITYNVHHAGLTFEVIKHGHLEPCADMPVTIIRLKGWHGHVTAFLEGYNFPAFGCHPPDENGNLVERTSF